MPLTDDPHDPRLGHGIDEGPIQQHDVYLVLSEVERSGDFVRPLQQRYLHARQLGGCGAVTFMGRELSETYARDPGFYGATYCVGCRMHKAVGEQGEFYWCSESGEPLRRGGAPSRQSDLWLVGT